MNPTRGAGPLSGSREVEPVTTTGRRQSKRSPSSQRRKARRAIENAVQTANEIQGAARARQRARAKGRAVQAAARTDKLDELYGNFRRDKRDIYASGLVPEGTGYRGRTSKAGK